MLTIYNVKRVLVKRPFIFLADLDFAQTGRIKKGGFKPQVQQYKNWP